jgi:hypothetical protein
MWDLWWTKWHWNRFFPEYFSFTQSVSFHLCSITRTSEEPNQLHQECTIKRRCVRSICCGALNRRKVTYSFEACWLMQYSLRNAKFNTKTTFCQRSLYIYIYMLGLILATNGDYLLHQISSIVLCNGNIPYSFLGTQ